MEHALSSYTIRCHNSDSRRGTEDSYHHLDKIGSYDLFELFKAFAQARNNYKIVDGGKLKQVYKFAELKFNPKNRVITGWIEYGHYGIKSSIINITNNETEFQKKPDNADMLKYFFLFWVPKAKEGIALFHTIKSEGAKSVFQGEFSKYLNRYISRNIQYLPLAYDKAVQEWSNAEIKEIRAVRLKSSSDMADIPLSFANSHADYVIRPQKNSKLPRFSSILDKQSKEAKLIYELESKCEDVKVSLQINGKTRTFRVGNKSKTTLCEVVFPDTVKIIDGNPDLQSVYDWSIQILDEYKMKLYP